MKHSWGDELKYGALIILAVAILVGPVLAGTWLFMDRADDGALRIAAALGVGQLLGWVWWRASVVVLRRFENRHPLRKRGPITREKLAYIEEMALNAERAAVAARKELAERD